MSELLAQKNSFNISIINPAHEKRILQETYKKRGQIDLILGVK